MERLYRATLFALYQLTLIAGIVMLPVALVTRRIGVRVPMDSAVRSLKTSYEQTTHA